MRTRATARSGATRSRAAWSRRAAVAADPELARLDVADARVDADALLEEFTRLTGRPASPVLRHRLLLSVHLAASAVQLADLLDDADEGDALLDTRRRGGSTARRRGRLTGGTSSPGEERSAPG